MRNVGLNPSQRMQHHKAFLLLQAAADALSPQDCHTQLTCTVVILGQGDAACLTVHAVLFLQVFHHGCDLLWQTVAAGCANGHHSQQHPCQSPWVLPLDGEGADGSLPVGVALA